MAAERSRAVYVISVAAELAGVHPQTLRIYERKGLVDPARTVGGSRRYSDDDIERAAPHPGADQRGSQPRRREAGARARGGARRAAPSARRDRVPRAQAAVDRTHRQYRRDLVPLKQAVALFNR